MNFLKIVKSLLISTDDSEKLSTWSLLNIHKHGLLISVTLNLGLLQIKVCLRAGRRPFT